MTGPLRWESRFESGNRVIDFDHQVLFALANEVYATTLDGSTVVSPREMLVDFAGYAKRHVAREEAVMRTAGECEFEVNHRAHDELCARVADLTSDASDLEYRDVCVLAYEWLVSHIVALDLPRNEAAWNGAIAPQ